MYDPEDFPDLSQRNHAGLWAMGRTSTTPQLVFLSHSPPARFALDPVTFTLLDRSAQLSLRQETSMPSPSHTLPNKSQMYHTGFQSPPPLVPCPSESKRKAEACGRKRTWIAIGSFFQQGRRYKAGPHPHTSHLITANAPGEWRQLAGGSFRRQEGRGGVSMVASVLTTS